MCVSLVKYSACLQAGIIKSDITYTKTVPF